MYDFIVIGGGAAGIFGAISAKLSNRSLKVLVLEKSAVLLSKVRISGGGRCNVTHSCFDPSILIQQYPRGSKELLAPFHRFQPRDTIHWFESRGISLKTEPDGRVFPSSDTSETIIETLLSEAKQLGIEIRMKQKIETVSKFEGGFRVNEIVGKRLLLATGSSPDGHRWASQLGHTIEKPVPSLFTFNVPSSPLKEWSGISVEEAEVRIGGTSLAQKGALLITHFGFSGPAALKLSAWGAPILHERQYRFELLVNWLPNLEMKEIEGTLFSLKKGVPSRTLLGENPFKLPKNLWKTLLNDPRKLNDFSLKELRGIGEKLQRDLYQVEGKTTHKEEFVTCGGVNLKEVEFKTMESKISPGLHFAGEILNIDGLTGGFNFQSAWTTSYIAALGASLKSGSS